LARNYGAIVRFLGYNPEPVDSSLAGRLRARRRALGLSQAELAAWLGLDEGTIIDTEQGRRRATRRVALVIKRFLAAADP
jgi:DNA-binding XRE family transcriptional regulator